MSGSQRDGLPQSHSWMPPIRPGRGCCRPRGTPAGGKGNGAGRRQRALTERRRPPPSRAPLVDQGGESFSAGGPGLPEGPRPAKRESRGRGKSAAQRAGEARPRRAALSRCARGRSRHGWRRPRAPRRHGRAELRTRGGAFSVLGSEFELAFTGHGDASVRHGRAFRDRACVSHRPSDRRRRSVPGRICGP